MNYKCHCLRCEATWWQRGSYEPDTNAVCLDDKETPEGMCGCDDYEIVDEEPVEFDD